jgi:DNA-directed RNA polymerase subunit N (RpoN/RPB10)
MKGQPKSMEKTGFVVSKTMLKAKLFQKKCSCGNLLGMRQKDYQETVEDYIKKGMTLTEARNQTLKDFGWFKMCCRSNVLNASVYYIRDIFSDSIVSISANTKIVIRGDDVQTSRPVPEYPSVFTNKK